MMRFFQTLLLAGGMLLTSAAHAQTPVAQTDLGTVTALKKSVKENLSRQLLKSEGVTQATPLTFQLPEGREVAVQINSEGQRSDDLAVFGGLVDGEGSFYLDFADDELAGHLILDDGRAYVFTTGKTGEAILKTEDPDHLVCTEYPVIVDPKRSTTAGALEKATHSKESRPGAPRCIFLDFDGYFMPAGTRWFEGRSLLAQPSGMSNAEIDISWQIVSEDFRQYDVNVTTNERVFDSYPHQQPHAGRGHHYQRRSTPGRRRSAIELLRVQIRRTLLGI